LSLHGRVVKWQTR